MVGKLYPHDNEAVAQDAFEPLQRALLRAVVLPHNPQSPPALLRTLIDGLIVLDDIESTDGALWLVAHATRNRQIESAVDCG